mgnify:FL=1
MSETLSPAPLSTRLKAETAAQHQLLDNEISSRNLFGSAQGYRDFVRLQYRFHRDLDPVYRDTRLEAFIPDLQSRNRFAHITQDMKDLGLDIPRQNTPNGPEFFTRLQTETAIGWLYVAEGSKLGANILDKLAQNLGYSADFGARHLAPAPAGRGPSWLAFRKMLDDTAIDPEACIDGARDAFAHMARYLAEQ